MFFREVVFGRLHASILEGLGLDLDGFGSPSWGHVGSGWVSIGPRIAIFCVYWAILAPWTGFELQQEPILERWRPNILKSSKMQKKSIFFKWGSHEGFFKGGARRGGAAAAVE